MPLTLISFGYLHLGDEAPPPADRTEDVRDRLRDPAAAKGILDLDGEDDRVQRIVLSTSGARQLLDNLLNYIHNCQPTRIAIGCAGGRHRAPALVELLAEALWDMGGEDIHVVHMHIHLARVVRGNTMES